MMMMMMMTMRKGAASSSCLRRISTRSISTGYRLTSASCLRPCASKAHALKSLTMTRTYAVETIKVPPMAESITEGTLKTWIKKKGDYVKQDEEIASIETDKIDVAVNSPTAGVIVETLANEDDTVEVGQDLVKIDTDGKPSAEAPKEEPKKEEKSAPKKEAAAPAPKKETPSEQPAPKKEAAPPPPKKEAAPPPPPPSKPSKPETTSPPQSFSREEHKIKMNRMRLRIAQRLKESQNTAAALTTFNEIDMSSLMEFRKLYKDDILKQRGIKLGFMGAFSRASVLAMRDIPSVNGAIEGPNGGDTIVYRDYVDLSIAVATPKGLVTPIVRNAESLSVLEIEKAIHDLGVKARDNKLTIEDMAGGTFTISNGGVFGSLMGTPIINLPQTAVLGLHGIKERAVVVNGKVEARPMMYVALTYDHRLCDGREAVTFLKNVKEYIEDPRRMLL